MKNVQTSMYAQLVYMLGMGLGLLFIPNLLLPVFGLAEPADVWVRVLGALALVLCTYYYAMIKQQNTTYYRATIWGRYGFCAALTALVVLGFAEKPLLIFAAAEAALAGWTHFALGNLGLANKA